MQGPTKMAVVQKEKTTGSCQDGGCPGELMGSKESWVLPRWRLSRRGCKKVNNGENKGGLVRKNLFLCWGFCLYPYLCPLSPFLCPAGSHSLPSLHSYHVGQGQGTRVSRESHLLLHEGLDYGAANCILVSQVLNASCSI